MDLVSQVPDVRKELLKGFVEGLQMRLTGPTPEPVYIPPIDPEGPKYHGLVLVPHGWPKSALNP
jgi:hypothetical protein